MVFNTIMVNDKEEIQMEPENVIRQLFKLPHVIGFFDRMEDQYKLILEQRTAINQHYKLIREQRKLCKKLFIIATQKEKKDAKH